jgi:hypothetical protein
MITLSLNFGGAHAKKVRDLIDTHLGFPGSDKLKMGLTIKDSGTASVTFAGPNEVVSEAKRLWTEKGKPAVEDFSKEVKSQIKAATEKVKAVAKKSPVQVKVTRSGSNVKATVNASGLKKAAKKAKKTVRKAVKKAAPKKKTVKKKK